jgi:predicted XRE-type DNA-binding protein
MTKRVTPSSGNVFEDIGFSPEEAENLKIRATLMVSLRRIIEDAGITQAQAAEAFGVTQPRVSDLVRGKIELFSIDTLVNMLAAAGHHVEVSVEPRPTRAA